jgi:hypothetical protein
MEMIGTFEAVVNGVPNAPKITCTFSLENDIAAFTIPYCKFESDSIDFSLSGLPGFLQPANAKTHDLVAESQGAYTQGSALIDPAHPGVVVFSRPGGWPSTGTKGLGFAGAGVGPLAQTTYSDVSLRYELSR